jgi:hypothetical protein
MRKKKKNADAATRSNIFVLRRIPLSCLNVRLLINCHLFCVYRIQIHSRQGEVSLVVLLPSRIEVGDF